MYKSQFPIRRFNAKTSALFIVHLDNSTWIKTLKNCEKDLALVLHNSCSETLLSISSHAYRSHMCFNSDRCSCATVLFSFYPKGWCSGRYMTFEPLRLFNISSCIQFPEWFRIILWCMYKTLKKNCDEYYELRMYLLLFWSSPCIELHLQMFWVDMSRILLNWVICFFIKGRKPIELSRFENKNTFKKHFELVLHSSLMVE